MQRNRDRVWSAGVSATTRTRTYVAKPYFTKGQPVETYDPQQLVGTELITQGGEKLLTDEDIISQMMEEFGYKKGIQDSRALRFSD